MKIINFIQNRIKIPPERLRGRGRGGERRRVRGTVQATPPGRRDDGHHDARDGRHLRPQGDPRRRSGRQRGDVHRDGPEEHGRGGHSGGCARFHREALPAGSGARSAWESRRLRSRCREGPIR